MADIKTYRIGTDTDVMFPEYTATGAAGLPPRPAADVYRKGFAVVDGILQYSNGVTWAPVDAGGPGGGGAVDSVNGQTGIVVLDAGDISGVMLASDKGATNGVAPLVGALVPIANLPVMQPAGVGHAPGLVPDPGSVDDGLFLRQDGQWAAPSSALSPVASVAGKTGTVLLNANDVSGVEAAANKGVADGYAELDSAGLVPLAQLPAMGASGDDHSAGLVPDPGATAGTTKFLREDGTWQVPPAPDALTDVATTTADGLMSSEDKVKLDALDYQTETYDLMWARIGLQTTFALDGATLAQDVESFSVEVAGNLTDVALVTYFLNGSHVADVTDPPFRTSFSLSEMQPTNALVARIVFMRNFVTLGVAAFSVEAPQIPKTLKTSDPNPVVIEMPTGSTLANRTLTVETSDGEPVSLTVTDDAAWLDSSVSGAVVTLAFTGVSALGVGDYISTVSVDMAGYGSLVISVSLRVRAVSFVIQHAGDTAFTNAVPIEGQVVTGPRAIGLTPLTGITSVQWFLDNVLAVVRSASPFDFGADEAASAAALWDSSVVANAVHTIKAVIALTGASSVNQILQSQTFGSGLGWDKFTTAAVTGSTTAGPEPGQTLMLVQASTNVTTAQHTFGRFISKPSSTQQTCWLRVTVKPDPANPHYAFVLYLAESSTTLGTSTQFARIYFRLDAGNISTYSPGTANGGDGWSVLEHAVTANVDGSYWIDFKVTTNAAGTLYTRLVFANPASPTGSSYINSVLTGAYLSFQFAFGSTMTPYVATTTTEQVTAGAAPVTVESAFTTQNASKVLIAEPSSLVFTGTLPSTNPTAQNLTIKASSGTAAVTFSEQVDMPWLASVTGGSADVATGLVKSIAPTVSGQTAGGKQGILLASAVGYEPVAIPINFNVQDAAPTYTMYYSPNGVGVAPVSVLQGATTGLEPYVWLAATSAPSTPITLAGADSFSFWNTATTDAEEATRPPVRTMLAPNNAYPAGSFTNFTGQMWEAAVGPKNYHWRLIRNGVTSRGNVSYVYGQASAHKDAKGLVLRMDRYEGKGPGQTDGQHFFSTAETNYLASTSVVAIGVMFGWNKIERAAGSGTTSGTFTWAQVDHMVATAAALGKKIIICISPKKWAGNPPPDLAAQANLWNTGTGSDFTGLANWNNATMRARYKNIARAFSQRYDSNPTVLGFWTDETSQGVNAAYDSLSGSNQVSRATGWYQMLYELITETPQLFQNTHFFIGATVFNQAQMPGGNFELLANAGVGIAWPDALYASATIDRGQRLMYSYKGRVAGFAWGDSYQNAGSEGYPDTDRPRLILRMNIDWQIPTPLIGAYGPPTSEAGCTRAQLIGFMPVATSVRTPPIQARYASDVANNVTFIQQNPQYFAGIPTASNLVNKI